MARIPFGSVPLLKSHNRAFSFSSAVHVSNGAKAMSDHHKSSPEIVGGAQWSPALKAALSRPYTPFPLITWNRHVETIFAAFFRSVPDVRLRRECLRTKDDGSVALDWIAGDKGNLAPGSPLLILLVRSSDLISYSLCFFVWLGCY